MINKLISLAEIKSHKRKRAKNIIATSIIALMFLAQIFISGKALIDYQATKEMTVQTEEEAVLKAKYEDKAYFQLWLAGCWGCYSLT